MTLLLAFVIGFALPGSAISAAKGRETSASLFALVTAVSIVLLATLP